MRKRRVKETIAYEGKFNEKFNERMSKQNERGKT